MSKRKAISKKIRFEVFKRDKFQCQYCGNSAPDVILECDHISPVSKGGDSDILNLITSCFDCNRGKSNRELNDTLIVDKQREQLAELEERRQQLKAMLDWRDGLKSIDNDILEKIKDEWYENTGYSFNEIGIVEAKKWLKRFSIIEILDALEISISQYAEYDDNLDQTHESVERCFQMIPKIASTKRKTQDNPDLKELYYARGILRNRVNYCNDWQAINLLKEAYEAGMDVEDLKDLCRDVKNWSQFKNEIACICDV